MLDLNNGDWWLTEHHKDSTENQRREDLSETPPDLEHWANIPVDIARLIFEKTMEDAPLPVHVALVSRQVQRWVEPLIYQHLVFRDPTQFTLFYRTFRNRRYSPTKSTSFFAKHVKTLHVLSKAAPKMEQMVAVGRNLKSIKATAGWDNSWGCFTLGFLASDCMGMHSGRAIDLGSGPQYRAREERDDAEKRRRAGNRDHLFWDWAEHEAEKDGRGDVLDTKAGVNEGDSNDGFPYKDLRRLSISAYALRLFRIDFTHQIFQDLTHLDVYYCRQYEWSTLSAMKNLTHLAVDFLTLVNLNFDELKQSMENTIKICKTLPHMKAIIFACVNWWSKNFDIMDDEHNMLAPLNFSTENWDSCGPLIETDVDEYRLHYYTQLCLGIPDRRVVLGVVSDCLQESHLMNDYMVDFVWPKNSHDWDFTVPAKRHRESWDVAEEIIERREKERRERRRRAGKPLVVDDTRDQNQRVEGEFGFGEMVMRRWNGG